METPVDRFSGRLALMVSAMHALDAATLAAATWEPHDWSDFA